MVVLEMLAYKKANKEQRYIIDRGTRKVVQDGYIRYPVYEYNGDRCAFNIERETWLY